MNNIFELWYKEKGKFLARERWYWRDEVECYFLKNIIKEMEPNVILDVGCGIGSKLNVLKNYNVIGLDYSFSAVRICKDDGFDVIQSSVNQMPFKDNSFDFVYCFRVFQILPSWDLIKDSFKEVTRVLKVGGYLLMSDFRLGGSFKCRYLPKKEGNYILHRWSFSFEDYANFANENNLRIVKLGTLYNIRPKGIGKLTFLKNLYKFIDYQLFRANYRNGLHIIGLFQKRN